MSNAIVARALNDTVGTPKFKGINTIFDEHLNKLDEILKENIEAIKEAVMPLSNLSNPIYMYKDGDFCIASVEKQVESSINDVITSPKIRLSYSGIVAVKKDKHSTIHCVNAELVDSLYVESSQLSIYKVFENSEFYVSIKEIPEQWYKIELKIFAHTEFAPSYNVEIIE